MTLSTAHFNTIFAAVKGKAIRIISSLLLLLMLATVTPFGALHHHEEDSSCDIENEVLENDPCHVSSFHSNELQKPHCKHKSHVHKKHDECEICKIFTSTTNKYFLSKGAASKVLLISNSNTTPVVSPLYCTSIRGNFGRAPPAQLFS